MVGGGGHEIRRQREVTGRCCLPGPTSLDDKQRDGNASTFASIIHPGVGAAVCRGVACRGTGGGTEICAGITLGDIGYRERWVISQRGRGIRNLQRCITPGRTSTVCSKQRLRLRLPPRNDQQSKRTRPGVSDAVYMAMSVAATVSHLEEQPCDHDRDCDCGEIISILPDVTRRKGKLPQIVRK